MRVLLDLNVILDVLGQRAPLFTASARVWDAVLQGRATGFVAAHAFTTAYYLLRRKIGSAGALAAVKLLLENFGVAGCDTRALSNAALADFPDFEDAVTAAVAEAAGCQAIVTRNTRDFRNSSVSAMAPDEFLQRIGPGPA